jgi:hypothetical protein
MANKLPPLTAGGQQVMSLVLNAVAFGMYADVGNVDSPAEKLGTTPGRLRTMLRKLIGQGLSHDRRRSGGERLSDCGGFAVAGSEAQRAGRKGDSAAPEICKQ